MSAADLEALLQSRLELIVTHPGALRGLDLTLQTLDELRARQRSHFYYYETVTLLVIVKASLSPEQLRECLAATQIAASANLAAYPAQRAPQPPTTEGLREPPPIRLVLDSSTFPIQEHTILASDTSNESILVVRTGLHLQHPERPLTRPTMAFAASLQVSVPAKSATDSIDDYLPSGIPVTGSVLAPILAAAGFSRDDKTLQSTAQPKPAARPDIRSVDLYSPTFDVRAALLLRTSRTVCPDQAYLSLDVQVSDVSSVHIGSVQCMLGSSEASLLLPMAFPAPMTQGDRSSFVFTTDTETAAGTAQFQILASSQLEDGSSIDMVVRRSLLAAQVKPLSRERVKTWSSSRGQTIDAQNIPQSLSQPTGLKISISGPDRVKINEEFRLTFFVVNNGTKKRRLVILGPPVGGNAAATRPMTKSSWTVDAGADELAAAAMDTSGLYQATIGTRFAERRKSGIASGAEAAGLRADVVTLDQEVRLGSLPPGAAHQASMRMRAFGVGVVSIEGTVAVDLDSKETCLIGEGWEAVCYDDSD